MNEFWGTVMSFFESLKVYLRKKLKSSVKANPNIRTVSPNIKHRKAWLFPKKAPLFIRGSMTVEASLAVPIFLFFIINLLSIIMIYERYSVNLSKLHQQAKTLALSAHLLGPTNDEMVSLTVPLSLTPFINEIGFEGSLTVANAECRKWTGYDVLSTSANTTQEEYVYVTEYGSVYHKSRDCSHLKITISVISMDGVDSARNENGEKYYKCEKCGDGSSTGVVFVSRQGNRFHNSPNCSGLTRHIKTVKLSDVQGMPGCGGCT